MTVLPRFLPLTLVVAFGALMGLVVPLAKMAGAHGLAAPAFAFWQSLGAGLLIALLSAARRHPLPLDWRHLRFYLLSGLTGISLPNLAVFSAAAPLGAGVVSLAYAFPPLFPMVLASLAGVERLTAGRLAGLLLGLAGTAMIALDGQALPASPNPLWLLVVLAAPLTLAIGNVYRTLHWPPGSAPMPLAAGMLLGGAAELLPTLPWLDNAVPMAAVAWGAVLATIAATAVAYLMFMEIQRHGGPVTLSLVGFVITPVGLAVGVLGLDEHYGTTVWAATAVILGGLLLSQVTGRRPLRPKPPGCD